MRQLFPSPSDELNDDDLVRLYDATSPPSESCSGTASFVRLNMVSSVDGAAAGADGRSGTINSPADGRVFEVLRAWADVVLIGRGTYDAESYSALQTVEGFARCRAGRAAHPVLAVLTSSDLPTQAAAAHAGSVFAVSGELADVIAELRRRGLPRVLCEGGPRLGSSMVAAGLVDELCVSTTPITLSGEARRILTGPARHTDVKLRSLLEEDGTLIARWHVLEATDPR